MEKRENTARVILNEQHSLLPDQIRALDEQFSSWEILPVPASGWTQVEMAEVGRPLCEKAAPGVFVSPVPVLLGVLAGKCDLHWSHGHRPFEVWVMHNDLREKKELPGGKIIQTVAQTGWELVCVAA